MFAFIIYGMLTVFVAAITKATPTERVFSRCSLSKQDIFLVMDGSRFVRNKDFNMVKTFLQRYLSKFDVGLGKTHVGLLLTNDKKNTRIEINLGQHSSSKALSNAIATTNCRGRRRPDLAHALEIVKNKVFTNKGGDRPGVRDLLIVFTQRIRAIKLESVIRKAEELKSRKVEIITIPIQSTKITWSFKDELTAIASSPKNVLIIQPNRFKKLKRALNKRICLSKRGLHPTIGCSRTHHDVFFVLDGSGSISLDFFNKMKDFLIKLIENLDVGKHSTHVGLLQFSHKLKTRIEFKLGELQTFEEIKTAIKKMDYQKGGTETGHALAIVNEKVFPSERLYRPNVRDVVVILTDGEARDRLKALNESEKLHQKGVHVIAVGMGDENTVSLFRQDLQLMATDPGDVFTANFKQLPNLIFALTTGICSARTPRAIKCAHQRNDILLIVDGSASVQATNMDKVKMFLKKLVMELNIGRRQNHISLIQFSEAMKTRTEFNFNQYYDVEKVGKAIDDMKYQSGFRTMTGYALAMANRTVFVGHHGDRPYVSDVIIVVADGGAHDKLVALANADSLKKRGIKILTVYIPNSNDDTNGKELLRNIASTPGDAYISNFDHLKYIAADLVKVVCSE